MNLYQKEVGEFVLMFMTKYGSLISSIARRYLIPNRYNVDDIKQYISERIIKILATRLEEGTNLIDNPEKYFKSCLEFYCIEYQRMHGYCFDLPKRPRKNCEEDEKTAKAWGFKYLGDISIDEYNSIHEYTLEKDLTEEQNKPTTTSVWGILTGVLTDPEAKVIECIFFRRMTWNETSLHLGVAQSTCWFRKNRAIKKIYDAFDNLDGLIDENLKLILRGDHNKLMELADGKDRDK
jgi:RNA polymerase sigma factor (sigma-70 family)